MKIESVKVNFAVADRISRKNINEMLAEFVASVRNIGFYGIEIEKDGKPVAASVSDNDQVVSCKDAAKMLSVSSRTMQLYARRGFVHRVCLGAKGERAMGYTLSSIKAAMAKKRGEAA